MAIMGLIGSSQPSSGATATSGQAKEPDRASSTDSSTSTDTSHTAGNASGQQADAPRTAGQTPPVTSARGVNGTASRSGSDGGDSVARAQNAQTDAARLLQAFAPDADENRARRYAEAAQDRLVSQQLLSRIPLPTEARPNLMVETTTTNDGITSSGTPPRGRTA